ncbi:MAG: NAD(P)-binding domain-containing protein [Hyphomicrobiales bacterium]
MTSAVSTPDCQVAVIGAGPYGLSAAAHLRGAGIETRVFGDAMSFWDRHMPKGMKLRSALVASNLADPDGRYSLKAYTTRHGLPLTYPFPREDFVNYGRWFQRNAVGDIDTRKVVTVDRKDGGFELKLDDGTRLRAARVVVATGLANQEYRPSEFAGLSPAQVSHTCDHADLSIFSGQRVAVVGRGQSACESAALLNMAGATVDLVTRGPIRWIGSETSGDEVPKDFKWRLHAWLTPKSGVGPFPLNWVAEHPWLVRRFPQSPRLSFTARCLKPASTSWVKPGFSGVRTISAAAPIAVGSSGRSVALTCDGTTGLYDHVLLATGYRIDIGQLGFIPPSLLGQIARIGGSPVLSHGLQSSVPGLHFLGSSSVMSYGPLMRFVAGADYAARHLARHVAMERGSPARGRAVQRPEAIAGGVEEFSVGRGG